MPMPPADEVHVHVLDISRAPEGVGALLPGSDLRRAELQGARWANARAGLRRALAQYLDEDPAALEIKDEGKPRLEPPSPLRFNLSHSGDLAVISVATEREVGVDVERIEPDRDVQRLAKRMFLAAEQAAVRESDDPLRDYHRYWVAKEAFAKATGKGLASMRSFEVSLDGPEGARLNHVANDPAEAKRWSIEMLDVQPGYVAAIAFEGTATVK
jgi:4'-phosphopantetheinyl transferase